MILYIIGLFIAFCLGYLCCGLCADGRIRDAEARCATLEKEKSDRTRQMGREEE